MCIRDRSTEKEFAEVSAAEEYEVNLAVESSYNAFNGEWSKILPYQRAQYLRAIGDQLKDKAELLGTVETKNTGKLYKETKFQANYIAEYYYYYAGLVDKIEGSTLPIDKEDMHVFTTRMPIGVVAAVVPWNAQMFLSATKLGPALAAGCSVILKASEIAPIPMLEFAKLIDHAGLPDGVVSVITGDAENCSIPLTSHPHVDRIAFTGGPETARNVVRNSAENFAVTTLELGGKSPILVFEDANIESAVNGIIAGNYGASGQSCVAGSRVIVHRTIKQKLIAKLIEKVNLINVGSPTNAKTHVGPLCTEQQITLIETTLEDAKLQGAKILFGGKRKDVEGYYFEPTLVDCHDDSIATLKVEMFGPVMSMLSFNEEQEAIDLANNTDYGLGSGVFTDNLARAHRVSKKIRAGICLSLIHI